MNGATNMIETKATVSQGASRYGVAEPQIELRAPKGTPHRRLRAALFALAAEAELATPREEGWIVQVEPIADEVGRVYLELTNGDEAETNRGMALLQRLCRRPQETRR